MDATLIGLGFDLAQALLDKFTKAKAPKEIIGALQASVDAIEKHALDVMSEQEWEALRG